MKRPRHRRSPSPPPAAPSHLPDPEAAALLRKARLETVSLEQERVCAHTASTVDVHVCLECGEYASGRSADGAGARHALRTGHATFLDLSTGGVWVLPAGLPVRPSLVASLAAAWRGCHTALGEDLPAPATALDGGKRLPGFCQLVDGCKGALAASFLLLARPPPVRDALLTVAATDDPSRLAARDLARSVWHGEALHSSHSCARLEAALGGTPATPLLGSLALIRAFGAAAKPLRGKTTAGPFWTLKADLPAAAAGRRSLPLAEALARHGREHPLSKAPGYLLVHVDRRGGDPCVVDVPVDPVELGEALGGPAGRWRAIGVVAWRGEAPGGAYHAFLRRAGDRWWECGPASATECLPDLVEVAAADLLLLERVG